MAKKNYKANDIEYNKDGTITLYISEFTYNSLESLGKQYFKDSRCREGLIKTYALIKLHQLISKGNDAVAIHSSLFALISKRNYTKYLDILQREMMINIIESPIDNYKDKSGKNCIRQEKNRYEVLEFGYDILGKQNKVFPVKLPIKDKDYKVLPIKSDYIKKHYDGVGLNEKREFVMSLNNEEVLLVKDIVNHIKKITNQSSKQHLTSFKSKYSHHYSESYIEDLIKEIVIRLDNNKEHIVGSNFDYIVDNKHNTRFSYYSELRFSIEALDECMCLRDLRDLASLNTIPEYGKDGKLYSVFSRIRRPIRKHITFRGNPLVEVSDISCAHFTMLPKIFGEYGIEITPWWELEGWLYLTQQGDLYSEVVKDTPIPRDAIKPTFQSFFSIKNETSYIYGGKEKDCSNRLILCRWFRNNYPNIYNALLSWHNTQSIKIKRAANRVESNIMNPICDDLRALGLHPFRLHDAIYLPLNEIDRVPFDITQRVYDYINKRTHINKVKTSYEAS
ncbi:MAG: hypothetical protein IKY20_02630 [Alistipes sp.]|nr:hypothetical protein [Alistipes sp.]